MPLSEEEEKRLYSFNKNTQNLHRVTSLNLEKEEKKLENDFRYFKNKLKEAVKEQDKNSIEKNIKQLTNLVAKKLALTLTRQEEIYNKIPEIIIKEETKKYITECYRLLAIRDTLLKK